MSATTALIIINTLVLIALTATSWQSLVSFPPHLLITFGGSSGVETIARLEIWRLATSAFLHGSIMHLAVNMFVLWKLGPEVESLFGCRRFVAIYVIAAVCGALASVVTHPLTVNVGASAAIFGIFGALLACVWRRPQHFPPGYLALHTKILAALIIYSVVCAFFDPTMDHAAHAAGFVAGFVSGLSLLPKSPHAVLRFTGVVGSVAALVITTIIVLPNSGAMYFARAAVLHNEGRDAEAVQILSRAIECNPKIAVAYNNRAWSEEAIGDYNAALADANKALELDPKSATTYDTRAVAYLMLGDEQKAVEDLNTALRLKADDGAFYYHRAVAKQKLHDLTYAQDAALARRFKYEVEHWEPKLVD